MKRCSFCGELNPDSIKICPWCGRKVDFDYKNERHDSRTPKLKKHLLKSFIQSLKRLLTFLFESQFLVVAKTFLVTFLYGILPGFLNSFISLVINLIIILPLLSGKLGGVLINNYKNNKTGGKNYKYMKIFQWLIMSASIYSSKWMFDYLFFLMDNPRLGQEFINSSTNNRGFIAYFLFSTFEGFSIKPAYNRALPVEYPYTVAIWVTEFSLILYMCWREIYSQTRKYH